MSPSKAPGSHAAKLSLLTIPQPIFNQICDATIRRIFRSDDDSAFFEAMSPFREDLVAVLALSLTCKNIHQACEPVLFRRVVLDNASPWAILRLLQRLIRRPRAANSVQILAMADPFAGGPGDLRADWTQAALDVVRSDATAAALLEGAKVRLQLLVLMHILRLVPNLTTLVTLTDTFQLHLWPKGQRLCGKNLRSLSLACHNHALNPHIRCDRQGGWLRSFQPDQGPMGLQRILLPHFCGSNPRHDEIRGDWSTHVASLKFLCLSKCRMLDLNAMIAPCRALRVLDVDHSTLKLDQILRAVAACSHLADQLQDLAIQHEANRDLLDHRINVDGNALSCLSHFTALERLKIPIPLRLSVVPTSVELPPNLNYLALDWRDHKKIPYRTHTFYKAVVAAIEARRVPSSLETVEFYWPSGWPDNGESALPFAFEPPSTEPFFDDDRDIDLVLKALVAVDTACKGAGIEVKHQAFKGETDCSTAQIVGEFAALLGSRLRKR